MPAWASVVIIAREFAVSGLRSIAASQGIVIAASWWGKIKTVTQMIAIIAAFLDIGVFCECFNGGLTGIHWFVNLIASVMMIVCVIATVFSGFDYLKNGKELLKDK